MRKFLIAVGAILVLVLVAGAWVLADLNRFRPLLEERLVAESGAAIRVQGDLGWELFPAPRLTAASVEALDGSWRVEQFGFQVFSGRYLIQGLQFRTPVVSGLCDLALSLAEGPTYAAQADGGQIVPLTFLSQITGGGACESVRLAGVGRGVEDLSLNLAAGDGAVRVVVGEQGFLGGVGQGELQLRLLPQAPDWTLQFDVKGLQAQALKPWLDAEVEWEGELDFTGELHLIGDKPAALASTMVGNIRLNGGAGRIFLPELNRILNTAARFTGGGEYAPEALPYSSLTVDWSIDGAHHSLRLNLDSLAVDAQGIYDILQDELDVLAELAIEDGVLPGGLAAGPVLAGLPVPIRCKGNFTAPDCGLDMARFGDVLVRLMGADAGSPDGQRLGAVVEKVVPPEYRGLAGSLLQLLPQGRDEDLE